MVKVGKSVIVGKSVKVGVNKSLLYCDNLSY